MSYLCQAFDELLRKDGLLVMAAGIGIRQVLHNFVKYYAERKNGNRDLVFLINFRQKPSRCIDALSMDGVPKELLPVAITNEISIKKREVLYKSKGVFIVTSRILVLDLLNKIVDPKLVSGILVYNAHRLDETCTESFILRLFRLENKVGFIKGFSDNPEALVHGFGKVEKVLRVLHVSALYVWPRFRMEIAEELEVHKPRLHEWMIDITPRMEAVQEAIVVTINVCLKELKKRVLKLDASELTLENGLFDSFDSYIHQQLDSDWHKLKPETHQLISDISTLRKLLEYLFKYDCVTFYRFIVDIKSAAAVQKHQSMWLTMDAADKLYESAKSRVYNVVEDKEICREQSEPIDVTSNFRLNRVLEQSPKWSTVSEIVQEMLEDVERNSSDISRSNKCLLILVKDENTVSLLQRYLQKGGSEVVLRTFRSFLRDRNEGVYKRMLQAQKLEPHVSRDSFPKAADHYVSAARVEENLLLSEEINFNVLLSAERSKSEDDAKQSLINAVAGAEQNDAIDSLKSKRIVSENNKMDQRRKRAKCSDGNTEETETSIASDSEDCLIGEVDSSSAKEEVAVIDLTEEMPFTFDIVNRPHILIYTHDQVAQNLFTFDLVRPSHVLVYDPDLRILREIESYCARNALTKNDLTVHFTMYRDSAENRKFQASGERETKAFNSLIEEMGRMIIPLSDCGAPPAPDLPLHDTRAGSHINKHLREGSITAVVDIREFRSSLPSLLHMNGFILAPLTIAVGDYILSPHICVERKSVSDLFQSFSSGRLWNQANAMKRAYKKPMLLIEFDADKCFCLQPPSQISADIRSHSINSKMVLLTISFPELKILWSRSSHMTVSLFRSITYREQAVDVEAAAAAGNESRDDVDSVSDLCSSARELLLKLPGVTMANYRALMKEGGSIAGLSKMDATQLQQLVGKASSKQLFNFFHEKFLL